METMTTLALPTEALQRLRDTWEQADDQTLRHDAVALIRDLFDGQDGYLRRINAALNEPAPIRLDVFSPGEEETDHLLVTFARPGRVEISVSERGDLLCHVYDGAQIDTEQHVLFAYDATVENESVSR